MPQPSGNRLKQGKNTLQNTKFANRLISKYLQFFASHVKDNLLRGIGKTAERLHEIVE